MHYEIWSETLEAIRLESPAVIVNWGTDDSWKFSEFSRFMARHVDAHVTTYWPALDMAKALQIKNVLASQWGIAAHDLRPPKPAKDCVHRVSFVGSRYGTRETWIAKLLGRGVKVDCFGHGWSGGVLTRSQVLDIFQNSVVSLNFSDSPLRLNGCRPAYVSQIKGRVFEVPGGGGLLLTQESDGLSNYFSIGQEIACFSDADDLASKVRWYLANPHVRDEIALAGHDRVQREHTYERRIETLVGQLSALFAERASRTRSGGVVSIEEAIRRHKTGRVLRGLKDVGVGAASLLFGRAKGARALRRLLFECSWRLAGSHTYSAAGIPGRLFYQES
jgi:spore maturation protein CgeB